MNETELANLMRLARTGDRRAYEELLRGLVPVFKSYYLRRVRDYLVEVDDFIQECLLAVHQRQITYDVTRPLLPWVYAIARHKLIDRFRARKEVLNLSDIDAAVSGYDSEPALSAKLDVETLLDHASPKQKTAIIATKIRGESIAEHAVAAGVSESDVKVSVHRGLKALSSFVRRKA
ncbi:MAG: hypothetical protein A3E78_13025 [Alphaproteobacteria bacterium RIFCSPHIGHO2_12_FULL_63_12]|nr:MAG: hypothetical protein A3E78_13025 [Alphaproteobacteria bacterium RIFCSPHIGHO2_12_FULL_63_12]